MKKSNLESILYRPQLYCGKRFESIDEFSLFFHGLSFGLQSKGMFSDAEHCAIQQFGVFMRHHLHGANKNCRWEYDLLSKVGSHDGAVQSAIVLMKFFHDRLQSEGVEKLDRIVLRAGDVHACLNDDGHYHVSKRFSVEPVPNHTTEPLSPSRGGSS